jgi:hypothetical protein
MRRMLILASCLLAAEAVPTSANAQIQGAVVTVWGLGISSCATAELYGNQINFEAWVMGYFTGLNSMSNTNPAVGHTTDAPGIWGEVQLICASNPSETLYAAASAAYMKLASEGR